MILIYTPTITSYDDTGSDVVEFRSSGLFDGSDCNSISFLLSELLSCGTWNSLFFSDFSLAWFFWIGFFEITSL